MSAVASASEMSRSSASPACRLTIELRRERREVAAELRGGTRQFRRHRDDAALIREDVQQRLADPPDGVADEFHVACRVETARRLHQVEIALVDEVEERHPRPRQRFAAHDEPQAGLDQLAKRGVVPWRIRAPSSRSSMEAPDLPDPAE
jgi:hypothetical protein